MKILKSLFLLTFLAMITFSSCTKENKGETTQTDPEVEVTATTTNALVGEVTGRSDGEGLELACFEIDTPFQLNINGENVTIESEEDLEAALTGLEEDPNTSVDFVYPINITYSDGETSVINNGEDLGEAFASCIPDTGWEEDPTGEDVFPAFLIGELNSCYQLAYPVALTDFDNNTYSADTEDEFIELLTENPELLFTFPINLIDEEGETVSADNIDGLFELLTECNTGVYEGDTTGTGFDCGFGIGSIGCYSVVFPATALVIDVDGNITEQTVADENALSALLIEGNFAGFGYPLTLADDEGTEVTVNSEDELYTALEACGFDFEGPEGDEIAFLFFIINENPDFDCYQINYPVTLDNDVEVNNVESALEQLSTGAGIAFPITVTQDGETVTIADLEALEVLVFGC